jgi:hypothetical protein
MKLSVQLGVVMLVAVVMAVAAFGYFGFSAAKTALIEQIGYEQQELAREIFVLIDRTLYQKYQEIQVIADANPVEDAIISLDTAAVEQRIDELLLQTGPWDSLEIFSTEGTQILGEKDMITSHKREERNAFTQSLQGQVYVSDVVYSEELGRATMIFSAPIHNENEREVIGVVIGKFSWPVILEILDGISKEGKEVYLFNKNGITIATPTIYRDEILQIDLTQFPLVQQALQGKCSNVLVEERFHHRGNIHTEQKHTPVLISCALQEGYLGFKSRGWGLIIETPQHIIFEPVQNMTRTFVIVAFIVFFSFIPLVFFLSHNIAKPLIILTQSNKDILTGKLKKAQQQQQQQQQRIIPDEIKELTETRQAMLQQLVGKKELDKKNKQLQLKVKELEKWEKLTVGRELRIKELKEKVNALEKSGENGTTNQRDT